MTEMIISQMTVTHVTMTYVTMTAAIHFQSPGSTTWIAIRRAARLNLPLRNAAGASP
jgi:hypothetical protein